jgi:hypothetical protein
MKRLCLVAITSIRYRTHVSELPNKERRAPRPVAAARKKKGETKEGREPVELPTKQVRSKVCLKRT